MIGDEKIEELIKVENVVSQTTNSAVFGSSSAGDDYYIIDPFESKKMQSLITEKDMLADQ